MPAAGVWLLTPSTLPSQEDIPSSVSIPTCFTGSRAAATPVLLFFFNSSLFLFVIYLFFGGRISYRGCPELTVAEDDFEL